MDARVTVTANPRIVDLRKMMQLNQRDMNEMTIILDTRFRSNEVKLFASQGSSGGDGWAALSPAYAAAKAKKYPGRKIMQRTGKLRKSLVTKGSGHVAVGRAKPRPVVSLGTTVQYAAHHIFGSHNKVQPKHERDVLQQSEKQIRGYYRLVTDFWIEKLHRFRRAMAADRWVKGRR